MASTTPSTTPPTLIRFRDAMNGVYGPMPLDPLDATTWTPPPKAGGFKGRYLWTDAFGVINLITLANESKNQVYLTLAKRLVETVHEIQGRTRDGQARLPGATDAIPLGGGLRIGKEDESGPDGDGQYHHYLTLWMFALNRLSIATKESRYNDLAIQLAKAIHPHFFVGRDTDTPRMVWKISTDMSKPLVRSEGNLDPIDGYITMHKLQHTATMNTTSSSTISSPSTSSTTTKPKPNATSTATVDPTTILSSELADYRKVMARKGKHFVSHDMLDLGMSLWSSHWLSDQEPWAAELQTDCISQLRHLLLAHGDGKNSINSNRRNRLAFRDFGACLGIKCVLSSSSPSPSSPVAAVQQTPEPAPDPNLASTPSQPSASCPKDALYRAAETLLSQWEAENMANMKKNLDLDATPVDLKPITLVMYAAALIPGAFQRAYLGLE